MNTPTPPTPGAGCAESDDYIEAALEEALGGIKRRHIQRHANIIAQPSTAKGPTVQITVDIYIGDLTRFSQMPFETRAGLHQGIQPIRDSPFIAAGNVVQWVARTFCC